MSSKWNWQDELQRLAMTYVSNPPTSLSDLFEEFERATKPKTPGGSNGFTDVVDDPRATPPQPGTNEDDPMPGHINNMIDVYTCPACKVKVKGHASYELLSEVHSDPDADGIMSMDVRMRGLLVQTHDCVPKITR